MNIYFLFGVKNFLCETFHVKKLKCLPLVDDVLLTSKLFGSDNITFEYYDIRFEALLYLLFFINLHLVLILYNFV